MYLHTTTDPVCLVWVEELFSHPVLAATPTPAPGSASVWTWLHGSTALLLNKQEYFSCTAVRLTYMFASLKSNTHVVPLNRSTVYSRVANVMVMEADRQR